VTEADYLPFVRRVAYPYLRMNHGADREDVIAAGCLGLARGLRRFDPDRGVQLQSFAQHHVLGAIRDHLRETDILAPADRRHVRGGAVSAPMLVYADQAGGLDWIEAAPLGRHTLASGRLVPLRRLDNSMVTTLYIAELLQAVPPSDRALLQAAYWDGHRSTACPRVRAAVARVMEHAMPTPQLCPVCGLTILRHGRSLRRWQAATTCSRSCRNVHQNRTNAARQARRTEAARLRHSGASYRAIAQALGTDVGNAHRLVRAADPARPRMAGIWRRLRALARHPEAAQHACVICERVFVRRPKHSDAQWRQLMTCGERSCAASWRWFQRRITGARRVP
jgi:RNA polymerase sigma factor (sigma-70 family)